MEHPREVRYERKVGRKMIRTARSTWLVWDEPLPTGKGISDGAAVFRWEDGDFWTCDAHDYEGRFPTTFLPERCEHIEFVINNRNERKYWRQHDEYHYDVERSTT